MKELSLHLLDIVQNSINAGASLIEISVEENTKRDLLIISVIDNGYGIDKSLINQIKSPFYTSRTTRKVGLGIPLLLVAAERCKGSLEIDSEPGKGTIVTASFVHSHIDRAPLGNLWDTISGLIICNINIDFVYEHIYNSKVFRLDTREIKNVLKGVPLSAPEVMDWIISYLKEGIMNLYGGVNNEDNSGTGGNKKEDPSDFKC